MLKNIVLTEVPKGGLTTFCLSCHDISLCDFYDDWAFQVAKKYSHNTTVSYCRKVGQFLDYILEAGLINPEGLTPKLMVKAIDQYESFLVFGEKSDTSSEIANSVATSLTPKPISGSSVESHFAAVNHFLTASENFRKSLKVLEGSGIIDSQLASATPLISNYREVPSIGVTGNIKSNSWLAGCIQGGARTIKRRGLKAKSRRAAVIHTDANGGDEHTFPFDKTKELIAAATSPRDKLLWTLLAASGCRISEALTILIDDIDFDSKLVYIIPPESRLKSYSPHLTEIETRKLSHKGRATSDTYLIEPFASLFWIYLYEYLEQYFKRGASHRFLFQKKNGQPFIKSYRAALANFRKASQEATGTAYGFHSLRHMYGYYLKNWAPTPDGFGFDLSTVMHFMGHKSITTTQRYARDDAMKLQALLHFSSDLTKQSEYSSISETKIKYLESEILRLKCVVEENNIPGSNS